MVDEAHDLYITNIEHGDGIRQYIEEERRRAGGGFNLRWMLQKDIEHWGRSYDLPRIQWLKCPRQDPTCRTRIAFLRYENVGCHEDVMHLLDGMEWYGRALHVRFNRVRTQAIYLEIFARNQQQRAHESTSTAASAASVVAVSAPTPASSTAASAASAQAAPVSVLVVPQCLTTASDSRAPQMTRSTLVTVDDADLLQMTPQAATNASSSVVASRLRTALSSLTSRTSRGVQCDLLESSSPESRVSNNSMLERMREAECCFCLLPIRERGRVVVSKCKHFFCHACVENWLEMINKDRERPYGDWVQTRADCPMCRTDLEEPDSLRELGLTKAGQQGGSYHDPVQVEAVIDELPTSLDELSREVERLAVRRAVTHSNASTQCRRRGCSWFAVMSSKRGCCPRCRRALLDCPDVVVPTCGHVLCSDCCRALIATGAGSCATCRTSLTSAWTFK